MRFQQKSSESLSLHRGTPAQQKAWKKLEKQFVIETDVVSAKESAIVEKEYLKIANPFDVDDKEFITLSSTKLTVKGKASTDPYEKENVLLKKFMQLAMEDGEFGKELDKAMAAQTDDDDDDDEETDLCFEKYCFIMKKQQSHVLRYCRSKDTEPLWYAEKKQWKNPAQTKKCAHCSKSLVFEF